MRLRRAVPTPSGQGVLETLPRRDPQLDEHLPQMPFDGTGGDEQFRSYLRIGVTVSSQPGDVLLLRGELMVGINSPLAHLLACGEQLSACPLGEPVSTHGCEHLV